MRPPFPGRSLFPAAAPVPLAAPRPPQAGRPAARGPWSPGPHLYPHTTPPSTPALPFKLPTGPSVTCRPTGARSWALHFFTIPFKTPCDTPLLRCRRTQRGFLEKLGAVGGRPRGTPIPRPPAQRPPAGPGGPEGSPLPLLSRGDAFHETCPPRRETARGAPGWRLRPTTARALACRCARRRRLTGASWQGKGGAVCSGFVIPKGLRGLWTCEVVMLSHSVAWIEACALEPRYAVSSSRQESFGSWGTFITTWVDNAVPNSLAHRIRANATPRSAPRRELAHGHITARASPRRAGRGSSSERSAKERAVAARPAAHRAPRFLNVWDFACGGAPRRRGWSKELVRSQESPVPLPPCGAPVALPERPLLSSSVLV